MTDTATTGSETSATDTTIKTTQPGAAAIPQADPASGLDAMDSAQLDALADKIDKQRANRPESLSNQIAALQADLTESHRGKDKAVDDKHDAAAEANRMEKAIADIKATLRRTELVEAATVAGFKMPLVVADHLARSEGDVTELVTGLAGGGAFAMVTPATSATLGGPSSKPVATQSPGRAALEADIRTALGK